MPTNTKMSGSNLIEEIWCSKQTMQKEIIYEVQKNKKNYEVYFHGETMGCAQEKLNSLH